MLKIAHRGNVCGKNVKLENNPEYLLSASNLGYDVEFDVRLINKRWFLGHDSPDFEIDISFLNYFIENGWIHAKNGDAYFELLKEDKFNVFWHNTDDYVLTSKKFIWTYPNKLLYPNSICVLPELGYCGDIEKCHGICSDDFTEFNLF